MSEVKSQSICLITGRPIKLGQAFHPRYQAIAEGLRAMAARGEDLDPSLNSLRSQGLGSAQLFWLLDAQAADAEVAARAPKIEALPAPIEAPVEAAAEAPVEAAAEAPVEAAAEAPVEAEALIAVEAAAEAVVADEPTPRKRRRY